MKDYWIKRFLALEESNNSHAAHVLRKIEDVFDEAQRSIQKEISSWIVRYAKNNQVSMAEARKQLSKADLEELKWDVKKYIEHGKANAISQEWIKELENASAKFHINRLEALKLRVQQQLEVAYGNELDSVDSMLRSLYQDGYYHTIYEIQKGTHIGFGIGAINEKKLNKVMNNPWGADGKIFSDRIWEHKTKMVNELHSQILRIVIQGKSPDSAIKAMTNFLSKKGKNAKYNAGRLVMTEQAFISAAAQRDAFKELDVEEFEIVATLDSSTSELCRSLDGKHFPMKDYQISVTAPPFHPWCRTTTVPYFDDEWGMIGQRAARDEEGETYYVPANMTYEEWAEAFVEEDLNFEHFDITENGRFERINCNGDVNEYIKRIEHEFSIQNLTVKQLHRFWDKEVGYIQTSGYKDINDYMRGTKTKLDEMGRMPTIRILEKVTNNNALIKDYIGIRRVDMDYLKEVLNIDTEKIYKIKSRKNGQGKPRNEKIPKDYKAAQKIVDEINSLVGTSEGVINDKAFMSVSMDESLNYFSHFPIKFEIQMEKGTKGLLTDNTIESEIILKNGSSIEIIGSKVYNDCGDDCILVFAKIVQ